MKDSLLDEFSLPAESPTKGKKFVRPIPLDWLSQAAQLPGKALHVGVALWYLCGLNRSMITKLSNSVCQELGVDRYAKYRALKQLEESGLISVERSGQKSPLVTIKLIP